MYLFSRDSLSRQVRNFSKELDEINEGLGDYVEKMERELILKQVLLPKLQIQAAETSAKTAGKRRQLNSLSETKQEKSLKITQCQQVIRALTVRLGVPNNKLNSLDVTKRLSLIREHIRVQTEINEFVRNSESCVNYNNPVQSSVKSLRERDLN